MLINDSNIFFSSYNKLYLVQLFMISTSIKLHFKLSKERKITNTNSI